MIYFQIFTTFGYKSLKNSDIFARNDFYLKIRKGTALGIMATRCNQHYS